MERYIAWLRGINVGGKNLLPMKALKATLEGLGMEDVRTYIQSGNVVFDSKKRSSAALAKSISEAIESEFGLNIPVQVLTQAEIQAALEANPYPNAEGKAVHFTFLSAKAPRANFEALRALASPTETFELHGQVFYLHAPDGIGRSKLAAQIERHLGVPCTSRNLNTVRKVLTL